MLLVFFNLLLLEVGKTKFVAYVLAMFPGSYTYTYAGWLAGLSSKHCKIARRLARVRDIVC